MQVAGLCPLLPPPQLAFRAEREEGKETFASANFAGLHSLEVVEHVLSFLLLLDRRERPVLFFPAEQWAEELFFFPQGKYYRVKKVTLQPRHTHL